MFRRYTGSTVTNLMLSRRHGFMASGAELMRGVTVGICVILLNAAGGGTQGDSIEPPGGPNASLAASFRPSIAVIIGVLATMFSLTFLLLLYAKHCKTSAGGGGEGGARGGGDASRASAMAAAPLARRDSGVERSVIEALPIFKFASLKGTKDGLECAVCLSRYEDSEFLRLLPKCKHAFHIDCVDTWLDAHSSCPLCRDRVEAEDLFLFDHQVATFMADQNPEDAPQVFVQREESYGSFRRLAGIGSWRRDRSRNGSARDHDNNNNNNNMGCSSSSRRQEVSAGDHGVLLAEAAAADQEQFARRFAHRIIVSDVLFQRRWSDFKPSDLLFLSSQMILPGSGRLSSSSRPPPPPAFTMDSVLSDAGMNRSSSVPAGRAENMNGKRSMSEIIGFNRFSHSNNNSYLLPRDQASEIQNASRDTRWFSIARTTLQWLAGTDKKPAF